MPSLLDQIQGLSPDKLDSKLAELLSFNQLIKRWYIEDISTGEEYEYNPILNRWIIPNNDDNDNDNITNDATENFKKLKKLELEKLKLQKSNSSNNYKEIKRKNTCIYVEHLPLDISIDEIIKEFSKFGIISEDFKTGLKKIKLYKDDMGDFKGDCLIEYLKEESCNLAIELLNNTKLRIGDLNEIKLSKAEFKEKKKSVESDNGGITKPKLKLNFKEKLKLKKNISRIENKLSNWSDNEQEQEQEQEHQEQDDEKIVVFENVFKVESLKKDPLLKNEIIQDIKEGIQELNINSKSIQNIILYDLEINGIITVKFNNLKDANICISKMNLRYFDGLQLKVYKYDGFTRYKKSNEDENENELERLNEFGKWVDEV
ncbi:hypothetical protein CANARDRAFT_100588 [[Candida] arabinofermentans NRRL YB-2248]|uniref:RRM domain-containing protein n=1 Tax=[Candida] arabinofermentans NRRL YB-2248 TaxID=983967 RepID=A0A1E4SUL8_9ASCO|nr:hypothetical protein CANARDRAFT_100588 [[Candida] arabinofermentans NRRL YB-2248]